MSTKKLGSATDTTKPVAESFNYVNTVKSNSVPKVDPPPGDLIVIQCYAGKTMACMKVLIDSGSQLSTITEDALQRTGEGKNIRDTSIRMTSAQGSTFQVKGRSNLELQIGKKDYTCDLVVTPVLFTGVDIILGNDFFSNYHTKLITYPHKDPLFILESKIIPLVKANSQEGSYQVFNIAQDEEDQPIGVVSFCLILQELNLTKIYNC